MLGLGELAFEVIANSIGVALSMLVWGERPGCAGRDAACIPYCMPAVEAMVTIVVERDEAFVKVVSGESCMVVRGVVIIGVAAGRAPLFTTEDTTAGMMLIASGVSLESWFMFSQVCWLIVPQRPSPSSVNSPSVWSTGLVPNYPYPTSKRRIFIRNVSILYLRLLYNLNENRQKFNC